MKKRLRASTVCEAEGHLLVVRLRDPASGVEAFYPPGGGIEPDESPADAAQRETLEETGLRVTVDPKSELVEVYPFVWNASEYECTTHFFHATAKTREALPSVVDADYHRGAAWLPLEEALDALAVNPAIAAPVARVLNLAHRRAWEAEPRFTATQAAHLLAIHDQFRMAARRILAGDVRFFVPLAEVLHHHHHAEEVMLFPLVTQRTGKEPKRLVDDHGELTSAIARAEDEPNTENLARFVAVLEAHLDREELQVIPVLLDAES